MSNQVLRTEIVSDNVTLYTVRSSVEIVTHVEYETVCNLCNIAESFDNRPDALAAGREHECEMGESGA